MKKVLNFNYYKGSGKVWLARTDEEGKIKEFLRGMREYQDRRSGTITYELGDGFYVYNRPNTRESDMRVWIEVKNGEERVIKEQMKNVVPNRR